MYKLNYIILSYDKITLILSLKTELENKETMENMSLVIIMTNLFYACPQP